MLTKRWKKWTVIGLFAIALLVAIVSIGFANPDRRANGALAILDEEAMHRILSTAVPPPGEDEPVSYRLWHTEQEEAEASQPADLQSYAAAAAVLSGDKGLRMDGESLAWDGSEGWAEWTISVPAAGYYRIGLVFESLVRQGGDIVRGVQVDGQYDYKEAEQFVLKRSFRHDPEEPKQDRLGNEFRPGSIEESDWNTAYFADYTVDAMPFVWKLSPGEHKVRIVGKAESMRVKELLVQGDRPPATYVRDKGAAPGKWIQIDEAERNVRKSNSSIQLQNSNEPLISPDPAGLIRFNSIGGDTFKKAGEWLEWTFEVPKEGAYEIGFKYLQSFMTNFSSYRSILIDGKSLYKELAYVAFPYSQQWQGKRLSDGGGEPILFPLSKGTHTIRMTAVSAPVMPVYEGILSVMVKMNDMEKEIRKVTGNYDKSSGGGNVDLSRDWDLEKYIPDLDGRMKEIANELTTLSDQLQLLSTGGRSDAENALRSAADDVARLNKGKRTLPNNLNVFYQLQTNLGNWLYKMIEQPLQIDYFWVSEPGAVQPKVTPGVFTDVAYSLQSFYRTFTVDYRSKKDDPKTIDVWVNRNRDYVSLIQQLADETFTPATGIPVNVNIVPDPQMFILGNAAGIQPDVALGVDGVMPVDFAMRGALQNLAEFPDYADTVKPFQPGALRMYHYDHGDYAVPELQAFSAFVYRTDILEELGISPPDTWADLYKMLPTLQQNGYDAYVNPKDFMPFLLQNQADLYTSDGMRSALDTEEAYKGFKQWTDFFTMYQLPKEVPSFFNHFRTGDIPIGVCDFGTYLQLQFAAPEIAGKWKLIPLPGNVDDQGVVERWTGSPMQAAVMFKKTANKDEAWEFMKWWVSAETQARFGNDIETQFGPEYRWNTANSEAFPQLPWPADQIRTITEQRRWYKEAPQVPGGYISARELDFAWNNTVVAKKNARESLEAAVNSINRELQRKQIEFGLRSDNGTILHPLDILQAPPPTGEVRP